MSDTPRTDSIPSKKPWSEEHVFLYKDLCCKLERELDAERKRADEAISAGRQVADYNMELLTLLADANRRADEAEKDAAKIRAAAIEDAILRMTTFAPTSNQCIRTGAAHITWGRVANTLADEIRALAPLPPGHVCVPVENVVTVDREGVHFGKYCWVSHEAITGCVAAEIPNRNKQYFEWFNRMLAAAKEPK